MSHIPASAMPHAKPHEQSEPTIAPPIRATSFPWLPLAIGGALVGAAITAALTLRSPAKPAPRRTTTQKTAGKPRAKSTRKPRARKEAAAD